MKELTQKVEEVFNSRYGDEYIVVQSPGRVNLIGEHTDYNDGFVLPAAIDKSIILALRLNDVEKVRVFALDKDEASTTDISDTISKSDLVWPNYLLGVIHQLREEGFRTQGVDCVFGGNIPIGAGMSSSAALEGGVLFGLNELLGLQIPPEKMAQLAQGAENNFVGVQCGIMDQFVSLNGKQGQALKLDCRSLEYENYPLDREDIRIVLCDTGVRRELATSEYNIRRRQCEQGLATLQQEDATIRSLRDVSLDTLWKNKEKLDDIIFKRCKYVVDENRRVLQACRDLENDDLSSFGRRMFKSHAGLRDEYEVSCKELDLLVNIARESPGVLGGRMMGGGFGGCTINLVE